MKPHLLSYLTQSKTPVKKQELLNYLRSMGWETTERQVRKMIEELIHEGELIEASERGYQIITTFEQLERARVYLDEKAEAIAIRKNLLLSNWNNKYKIELTLF